MDTTTAPAVFDRLNVLADATRSRLLSVLEEHELAVSELCQVVQLPQSTVSRNLRVLADAGWVASRADGRSRYYRMDPALDPDARTLWGLVRRDLEAAPFRGEDRERTRSVLERRNERSRAFFSESADRWDSVREGLFGTGADRFPLFGLLGADWVVADLGAGTGALSRALAPFVGRVIAVDRSREMLSAARERMESLHTAGTVELREGDLEALPLDDGEVHVAILSLVLHHVPDPPDVLAEAARVLRPGGRVVVVDMRPHQRLEYQEEMGHVWPGFEPERILRWMERAGLERATVRPLPPDPEAEGPLLFVAQATRPDPC